RLVLHDRISVVDPPVRFAARIDVGFVHVEEEYRLAPTPDGGTELVTDDDVSSRVPGLGWLAVALTKRNVATSMARLRAHCES
ncbi:MAG TPA: SRPBCC family protein, partial [Acidimicrobiia bacterium]|nr:SRPBCC family protein [Acidimicrobiia bacterium]